MNIREVLRKLLDKTEWAIIFEFENHTINDKTITVFKNYSDFFVKTEDYLVDFCFMVKFNNI